MQGQGGSPDSEPVSLLFILGKYPLLWLAWAAPNGIQAGYREWHRMGDMAAPLPGVAWGPCVKSSWPDIIQRAGAIKVDLSVSQEGYLLE